MGHEAEPTVPSAAYEVMLGQALRQYADEQFASAEKLLRALRAMIPKDMRPIKLMAAIRQMQKRYAEAAILYASVLERDPEDPFIIVALGEIKLHTYRVVDAVPLFRRLLENERYRDHPATHRARYLVTRFLEQFSKDK